MQVYGCLHSRISKFSEHCRILELVIPIIIHVNSGSNEEQQRIDCFIVFQHPKISRPFPACKRTLRCVHKNERSIVKFEVEHFLNHLVISVQTCINTCSIDKPISVIANVERRDQCVPVEIGCCKIIRRVLVDTIIIHSSSHVSLFVYHPPIRDNGGQI
jgi:hypothetical protein